MAMYQKGHTIKSSVASDDFEQKEGVGQLKYIKQFGIILFLSFLGEILHAILPLPVPAGIYGIIILFLCLELKIIPVSAVKETSRFLIEIMPIMFIPAAVGLMESWQVIQRSWVSYGVITVLSTVVVMAAAGKTVQAVMNLRKKQK